MVESTKGTPDAGLELEPFPGEHPARHAAREWLEKFNDHVAALPKVADGAEGRTTTPRTALAELASIDDNCSRGGCGAIYRVAGVVPIDEHGMPTFLIIPPCSCGRAPRRSPRLRFVSERDDSPPRAGPARPAFD